MQGEVVKQLVGQSFDKAAGPASRRCFIKRVDLWHIFFYHSYRQTHKCKHTHGCKYLCMLAVHVHTQTDPVFEVSSEASESPLSTVRAEVRHNSKFKTEAQRQQKHSLSGRSPPVTSSAKWLNNDAVDLPDQSLFAVKQDLYAIANMALKRGRQLAVFQMQ